MGNFIHRLLFIFLLIESVTASSAQTVQLALPHLEAAPGETVLIHLRAEELSGLFGFRIAFFLPNSADSFPLEYIPNSFSTSGTLVQNWTTLENDSTNQANPAHRLYGTLLFNGSSSEAASGKGTLLKFKIRIKANATEQIVPITLLTSGFFSTQLNDGAIPFEVVNGSITISTIPKTPTPTPDVISTATPTITPTSTPEIINTATPTITHTPTFTPTETTTLIPTHTPSPTITLTQTPTIEWSPTTIPTVSPTVEISKVVTVTDDLSSFIDLCGGIDYDRTNDRALVIRFSFGAAGLDPKEIRDLHVYVRIDDGESEQFLGRRDQNEDPFLEWRSGSRWLSPAFREGPVAGHFYEFRVYAIKQSGHPLFFGPFESYGGVDYQIGDNFTPTPTISISPTPLPLNFVMITDDQSSLIDLSGGTDYDTVNKQALCIRILPELKGIDRDSIKNIHVYVRELNGFFYEYLGQRTWKTDFHILWKPDGKKIVSKYQKGPQFNVVYEFQIYLILEDALSTVLGPFEPKGPIQFLEFGSIATPLPTAAPVPTSTPTQTVTRTPTVTSTPTPTPDLSIQISGIIRHLFSNQLISNAHVQIGENSTRSGSDGIYNLSLPNVGRYEVNVMADGYRPFSKSFLLTYSQELNIRMQPLPPTPTPRVEFFTVYGFVYDPETFDLLVGAKLEIGGQEGYTDEDGFFYIERVPRGDQTLSISLNNYSKYEQILNLQQNQELIISLNKISF